MVTYDFACTACGRCCTTPPALSLAELLPLADRFVAGIGVQRLTADAADEPRLRLRDALMIRVGAPPGRAAHVLVRLQGYAHETEPCPALADRRCTLHERGKPAMCRAVPLDPLLPDPLQEAVIAERHADQAWLEAACIRRGDRVSPDTIVTAQGAVPGPLAEAAAQVRRGLAEDRALWGEAVFRSLAPGLGRADLEAGTLVLPLVPLVLVLAPRSAGWHAAMLGLLAGQRRAIARAVERALARRHPNDREMTQRLREWAGLYRALEADLAARAAGAAA